MGEDTSTRGRLRAIFRRGDAGLGALVAALITAGLIANVVAARLSGDVVDAILQRDSGAARVAIVAGALVLAAEATWVAGGLLAAGLARRVATRLRSTVVERLFSLAPSDLTSRSAGELADRASNDVDILTNAVSEQFRTIGASTIGAVVVAVGAVVLDWRLGLAFVIAGALVLAVGAPLARRSSRASASLQREWATASGIVEEAFAARTDLRQALGQSLLLRRWYESGAGVVRARRETTRASIHLRGATVTLLNTLQIIVLIGGALAAVRGWIGPGRAWAMVALVGQFSDHLRELLRQAPRLTLVDAAIARLGELLSLEPERQISSTAATADTTGDDGEHRDEHREAAALGLRVRDLTVGYEAGDPVLHGVSLDLPAGAQLALIGRTGSGKSTLARAIVRAVDVPEGHVFVDDRDVTGIALRDLRRSVALMSQRVELLDDTIEANITLRDRSIDAARVVAAIELLDLADWIDEIGGLDTRLGHGGRQLSAGEAQLVAFARLLVRDPDVVILDEATARLDPVTEHRLQAATAGLLRGRTSVVIAHRLSTVRHADFVAVLDRGELVEFDRRAALEADPDSRFASAVRASADSEREVLELLDGGDDDGGDGQGDATDDGAAPTAVAEPDPIEIHPVSPERFAARLFARRRRLGLWGGALWAFNFWAEAITVAIWSGLVSDLQPGGHPWLAITAYSAILLASVLFAQFGERRFSLWWNFSNLTLRGNLMSAQLAPHDADTARVDHSPGEATARLWDSDEMITYADNWFDTISYVIVFAVVLPFVDASVPRWIVAIPLVAAGAATFVNRKRIASLAIDLAASRSAWTAQAANAFAAAGTIKSFAAEPAIVDDLHRRSETRERLAQRRRRQHVLLHSVLYGSTAAIAGAVLVLAARVGVPAARPAAVAGTAVALIELIRRMPPMGSLMISIMLTRPAVATKLRRMHALLPNDDIDVTVADRVVLPTLQGVAEPRPRPSLPSRHPFAGLTVADVCVDTAEGERLVGPVSVSIGVGEFVIVTGPVGSGKSVLLECLAGLRRRTHGEIRWNGEVVDDGSAMLRPPQVSYVSQTPHLVSGTIEENVGLDFDVDVADALRLAQFDLELDAPGGISTVVGHRGLRLSGGQSQRLAAARAFAPRSAVTVVDDLSSALDVHTETALWNALRRDGRTVIAASHSPVALALADRIIRLESGRVVSSKSCNTSPEPSLVTMSVEHRAANERSSL